LEGDIKREKGMKPEYLTSEKRYYTVRVIGSISTPQGWSINATGSDY
jgi:hypothetical protein